MCRRKLHGAARASVVERMQQAGTAKGIILVKVGSQQRPHAYADWPCRRLRAAAEGAAHDGSALPSPAE